MEQEEGREDKGVCESGKKLQGNEFNDLDRREKERAKVRGGERERGRNRERERFKKHNEKGHTQLMKSVKDNTRERETERTERAGEREREYGEI